MEQPQPVLKSAKDTQGCGMWNPSHKYDFSTLAVHAGVQPDPTTGAILTPVYRSTTFVQDSIGEYMKKGFSYSRTMNPTVRDLEDRVASLEKGVGASCFGTGMAAFCTIVSAFMNAGDHAVVSDCTYGGTNRACRVLFTRMGMTFTFVDMRDPSKVAGAIRPNTKLVVSETPTNPTLQLVDLRAISEICKEKGVLHVCDPTFITPYIMRPIEHGVDIVLQSTTKYFDGFDMTTGGAVICVKKEHHEQIQFTRNILGNIMTADVAFLQLQTVKTLPIRIRRQSETALKVAQFLETHPAVERVCYPGLASHPQKELADRYHEHGLNGGMLWFEVKGGTDSGVKLMNSIGRPFSLCENLGAIESIITCPAVMTHANMLKEDRLKVGISDGFVRCSCGLEDADDLIFALKTALDALKV